MWYHFICISVVGTNASVYDTKSFDLVTPSGSLKKDTAIV